MMLIFNNLWSWGKNPSINGTSQWWGMILNHSRGLDTNFVSNILICRESLNFILGI